MNSKIEQLKHIVKQLHQSVEDLSKLFPKKKFTLDGRLVGDIGEVIAENLYQIELFEKNLPFYDAKATYADLNVQIKATFKKSLTFNHCPDYYIGIKLYDDGSFEEIYNGPGKYIFEKYMQRKGIGTNLLSFPIKELMEISKTIDETEKIKLQKI